MNIELDMSGLDGFIAGLDNTISELQTFLAGQIEQEWYVFLDRAMIHSPYDTGELLNAWQLGEVEHIGTMTQADWANLMHYSGLVNYGTVHILPRRFFEKSLHEAQVGRIDRMSAAFRDFFEGKIRIHT